MITVAPSQRFTLTAIAREEKVASFAADVREGLLDEPKRLPCKYFYDHDGSLLFEKICALPEYYPTRAERSILVERRHEIAASVPGGVTLVELGGGSAVKTRLLIEAFLQREDELVFVPIDISRSMLESSSRELLSDYPGLRVRAVAGEYEQGLARLRNDPEQPKLILWLGSSIGNLGRPEATAFLRRLRSLCSSNDRLLIGIDLHKSRAVLEAAYDDAAGVTAQFNLNLLKRINRELGGQFDLSAFRHRAVYNETAGRVEMYLDSVREQVVRIDQLGLEVPFADGESIHTENSHKYTTASINALAEGAGLRVERRWLDGGERFSLNLFCPR